MVPVGVGALGETGTLHASRRSPPPCLGVQHLRGIDCLTTSAMLLVVARGDNALPHIFHSGVSTTATVYKIVGECPLVTNHRESFGNMRLNVW